MKVHGHNPATPARPTPASAPFHRVLQQTGAPQPPPRPPAPPRPALLPGPGTSPSRMPQPAGSGTQPPSSTSRPAGSALARGPVLSPSRSALANAESLGQARRAMHGEAHRLQGIRTEAQAANQEKTEHRLSELISQELARQLPVEPPLPLTPRAAPPLAEPSLGPTPVEGSTQAGEPRLAASVAGLAPPDSPNPQLRVQAALELIEKIEVFVRSQRPALRMSLGWPLSAMVEVERTGPREVALRIQGRHGPLAQEDLSRIREALGARGLRLRALHAE
ncbi:MAG: hypothetical protein JXB05_21955 [Myxococcaceae bacterium]|nr:hypothetical protein [Myxococcaceae bacterium]